MGRNLWRFISLYSISNPSIPEDLENLIDPLITEEETATLTDIPDGEEIYATLRMMSYKKALGPDGMTMFFSKHFWDAVGSDVIKVMQEFFEKGELLPDINAPNITLIPKMDNPSQVSQFKSISLYNVIYKLILKIMTERLKVVLLKLIFPFQLAFVPKHVSQDNYIMAAEIF